MLSPYRVIDLTDERGVLAGQMLADLGADVIQVEPPHGSSGRGVAPFFADRPDESIYWAAYTRGKRGITCNLDDLRAAATCFSSCWKRPISSSSPPTSAAWPSSDWTTSRCASSFRT